MDPPGIRTADLFLHLDSGEEECLGVLRCAFGLVPLGFRSPLKESLERLGSCKG